MPRIALVLVLYGLTVPFSFAQTNRVLNGGFEQLTACPTEVSSLAKNGIHLSSPTSGTTDIFSTCAVGKVGVPKNFRGLQNAFSGEAYAGLYLYSPNDYREYIQLELEGALQEEVYYELTLYVSLAESSTVSTNSFNVLFADSPIVLGTSRNLSKSRLLRLEKHKFHFQKLNWKGSSQEDQAWVPLQLRFKAKGFERYLVLGNFKGDERTKLLKTKNHTSTTKEFAYYYIDEIILTASQHQPYKRGEPYVLEGVRFKTDSYQLSEQAKKKIKELYTHLKEVPKIQITINGHTDDMGSNGHNDFLSHKRAMAVALYLKALGFPSERLVWKGHGDRKPLVPKMTEEARLKNRRVDFVITDFEDH